MPAPPRLVAVALVLGVLTLSGCTDDTSSSSSKQLTTTSAPSSPPGGDSDSSDPGQPKDPVPSPGGGATSPADAPTPQTLDFTGTTTDGSSFDGADLAGKPVVLWFWAPWCPVCKSQVPQVEDVAAEYADDVTVVGVGSLDDESAIDDFADDVDGVTMLQDPDGAIWQHFGITEQSSFVILDASGDEVDRTSYAEEIDLSAEVSNLAS